MSVATSCEREIPNDRVTTDERRRSLLLGGGLAAGAALMAATAPVQAQVGAHRTDDEPRVLDGQPVSTKSRAVTARKIFKRSTTSCSKVCGLARIDRVHSVVDNHACA